MTTHLTGTRATVSGIRAATHRAARKRLGDVLAGFADTAPHQAILDAIPGDLPRGARKAAAGYALALALGASGHGAAWADAARTNRAEAIAAGAASAAHHLSGGAIPPEITDPGLAPDLTGRDADDQLDALAGDLADLHDRHDTVDAGLVAATLAAAKGPHLISDQHVSAGFHTGSLAVYAALGDLGLVDWDCMDDACDDCEALAAAGPYDMSSVPGIPHPNCRCWTTPAEVP